MKPDIRKCIFVLALLLVAMALSAQEQSTYSESGTQGGYQGGYEEDQDRDIYYFNLPILKIFYHPRGYYILYRTPNLKIGKIYVPWEWMKLGDQRATYNVVRLGIPPYISYVTNKGDFCQIRINASIDPRHSTWGVISSSRVPDEYFDSDTITLTY